MGRASALVWRGRDTSATRTRTHFMQQSNSTPGGSETVHSGAERIDGGGIRQTAKGRTDPGLHHPTLNLQFRYDVRGGIMRRIIIVFGIAAAALILFVGAALLLLDVNKYSGVIQARLEQQLRRKVTLGRMSLGILPLRFQVRT